LEKKVTNLRNLGTGSRSRLPLGKAVGLAAVLPFAAAALSVSHSAPAAAQRNAARANPAIASSIAEFYRARGGAPATGAGWR
jgi:cytochrome c556